MTGGIDRRGFFGAAAVGATIALAPATARGAERAPRKARPSAADGGVTGTIAGHVVGASFADLNANTVAQTKLRVLDLIGCAIGSTRGEGNAALARVVAAGAGKPEATILGLGAKTSAREAAMANAILARSYDFEVMTVLARDLQVPSHHSPSTVMTALALAERHRTDGHDFLTALAVGDDLAARMLAAAGIDFQDGWDGAPLYSTLAAAAITARFIGLTAQQTRDALGMSTDQLGGTVQSLWDGAGAWKIQQGTAARNGIFAAELAKAGWSGMADALAGPFAFYGQYTPGIARPAVLTQGLGKEWYGEAYFKPYPSCAANHPTIECAVNLHDKHRLKPADIASVRLMVSPHVLGLFIYKPFLSGPSLHSQANFSIQFACANALLRGSFRQEHYEPAMVDEVKPLISVVNVESLPPGGRGVAIEVVTRDGRTLREALPGKPKHYPDVAGSTPQEIEAKFRQQVAFAGNVPAGLADQIVRRVGALDQEKDMAGFVDLVSRATRFPKV